MCKFGGSGGLFGNGGLGGLLGGLAGGALDFAFPELGVPLALATGGGSFLGNLAGGGNVGSAALEGLTAGAAGGLGSALSGGGFLGAAPGTGISGLFSGGAGAAGDVAGPAGAIGPSGALGPGGVPAAGVTDFAGGPATTAVLDATGIPSATGAAGAAAPTSLTTVGAAAPDATAATTTGTAAGVPSTPVAADSAITGGGGDASLGSKIMNYIKANPLAVLSAGAAAVPLLQGNTVPGLSDLKNQAALQATQGNQMASALTTGQLPQGAQATLDNNAQAARAAVRNEYGKMGLTGSTLEADKLAAIDQDQASQKFSMLKGVTDSGLAALGHSDELLKTIMNTEISQDKATADSIARLVAALAGGGATATKAAA